MKLPRLGFIRRFAAVGIGGASILILSCAKAEDEAPQITSSDNATFIVGQEGNTFTVTATGDPAPNLGYCCENLPSGTTFQNNGDGTATIAGVAPGDGGDYQITISANNGVEPDAHQQFYLTVYEATEITSDDHTTFTVGTNGQFTVETSGGYPTPSITLTCCDLPAGLSFADNGNGSGTLQGTPAAGTGGVYLNFIHADNAGGQREQDFNLTINEAPSITSANHVTFHEDTGTSFTVTATGFPAPTLSENGALPSGITFNPTTGVLSGSAALGTAGTYPITFTASNGVGSNAVQSFTLTIAPPLPCTSPAAGLVGWWTADGHATDIQNDNNGTLHGSASFTSGRVGQAFNLNGSTDYISLGHPDVLKWPFRMQGGRITVEAWVKPTALPPNGSLMAVAAKWNSNSSNNSNGNAYGLFLVNDNGTLRVLGKINQFGGVLIAQGGTVPLNSFTHVAMTYDQENYFVVRAFVNGVDVGFADGGVTGLNPSDVDVMIGRENDNISPNYFAGVIDELAIYDRGLTQAELSAIYNAGRNGKCSTSQCVSPTTNIIGWWPADNTAIDIQGNHNASMTNFARFAPGKVGQAFSFFGINDTVQAPPDPAWDLGTDPFTIDLWVRLDALNSTAALVSHEPGILSAGWIYFINGGNIQFHFTGTSSTVTGFSSFIPTFQRWYHFAVTRSGNTFKFYIDGVQVGSDQTNSSGTIPVNAPLSIGAGTSANSVTGRIDEVEIIHRTLSPSEIQAIYNAGRAGKCKSFTMFVSNKNNNTIEHFDVDGTDLGVFASAGLNAPTGLAFDRAGNLYVANNGNSTIRKFSPDGIDLGSWASGGLNQPNGLAFDLAGNLFAANTGSNTIERFSSSGSDLGPFASTGVSSPFDIGFDNRGSHGEDSGNLYVINNGNNTIRKFDWTGTDLGTLTASGLTSPRGIAFDNYGIAYVSNAAVHTISKIDILGGTSLFGNTGLNSPTGLCFDSGGNFYAANSGNNTVAKLDRSALSSIFANASLNAPAFIALKPISPLVPVLRSSAFTPPASGHVMVSGRALPNATVYLHATSNLVNGFSQLGSTVADGTGNFQYDDNAGSAHVRFYRATYP